MRRNGQKGMSSVFQLICSGYIAYLGIKITKDHGGGNNAIFACGVIFIILGGVYGLFVLFQMLKGTMRGLEEGEEPEPPEEEAETDAASESGTEEDEPEAAAEAGSGTEEDEPEAASDPGPEDRK